MARPLLLLLALLPSVPAAPDAPTEVTLGVLLPEDPLRFPWARPRVGPVVELALEAAGPRLRRARLAVRPVYASLEQEEGACDDELPRLQAVELRVSHHPDVLLFGPGCGTVRGLDDVARLARHWRLLLLTADLHTSEDGAVDFLARLHADPMGRELSAFVPHLLRRFNWTARAAFAFSPGLRGRLVHALLDGSGRLPPGPDFTGCSLFYNQPDEAVRFVRANGRVVFILGSPENLWQIMRLAQAQNMTNGDYVFFHLDLFGESLGAEGHHQAPKPWQSKEGQDAGDLREAFQTVLVITPHEPQTPEYWRFQSQRVLRTQRDFGVALNDSWKERMMAACFHDGLLLYLRALNETLRDGGNKRDTRRILEKMRGLKIQGVTGTVSIDSENDRGIDFDLWSMADVESGEYQVVGQYLGSEQRIKWTRPIHWKKGGPPLDNPPCVFDMEDPSCASRGNHSSLKTSDSVVNGHLVHGNFRCGLVSFQQSKESERN